ncbi:RNA-directed DNA polymerase, eukaryota, reverse transcriptase zinc-binding domain protein [Tanacetum coccineum]
MYFYNTRSQTTVFLKEEFISVFEPNEDGEEHNSLQPLQQLNHLISFTRTTIYTLYYQSKQHEYGSGSSGGLIFMWDPNFFSKESIWCDDSFIIIKGNWKNVVGDCYMVNIYIPQDQVSKLALWNRLQDFMHHHNGSYIMFGDMNAVRNEQEKVGSIFNNIEADYFKSFIDATGLVDLPIGGRCFTWMNKAGTKLSKLDRFLISEDVIDLLPNIRITALDRIWSDHNPILLHVEKN